MFLLAFIWTYYLSVTSLVVSATESSLSPLASNVCSLSSSGSGLSFLGFLCSPRVGNFGENKQKKRHVKMTSGTQI